MPDIQPDHAVFATGILLQSLKMEHATTLKVLEAIPADAAGYRPDTVARSAFELAWHIAAAEHLFLKSIADGAFSFGGTRPETIKTSADVVGWYKEQFPADVARVEALSPEELCRVVDFRGLFQLPAFQYLQFTQHHIVHHRGQLSVYLRAMGAKVPAIYGESFDSAAARKAATS